MASRILGLSISLLVCGFAASASADASVVVELKRPDGTAVSGSVVLAKGETKYRCDTDASGRCTLKGVAGGVYQVTAEQGGKTTKPKTAVIPPSGEVKLIVNAE